jgi:valyl-tRNA synthetase
MEPKYQPKDFEEKIYQTWEKNRIFEAKVDSRKKPFSIILPPPNANADLHLGHAMYVYEDIMIRYHRLIGDEVLWLPGADHAGFETQFVFEKELKKQGKSRFDFDRETLYRMIWDFVMRNRANMENQLKKLGFALDWSKKKFTLDEDIVKIVKETFKKLYDQGLVYHQKAVVNYCVHCGTSFSDLEVVYQEREGKLWHILYPFSLDAPAKGGIIVATTRPETMLGDCAVAVNPKDKRYRSLIGKKVYLPLVEREIPIISDLAVDPKFGTGAVKITPAHDETDYEIAKRNFSKEEFDKNMIAVIGTDGKITNLAPKEFQGMKINEARQLVLEKLKEKGLLIKEKDHHHRVGTCYKCGRVIEPLPLEQWFIKVKPLASKAKRLVKKGEIKIIPGRFKKISLWWLDHFHDWNISRQIVWGIRIPAYRCVNKKLKVKSEKLKVEINKDEWFISVEKPNKCLICGECQFEQTSDTFDTWFSSGQWPFATLLSQSGIPNLQSPISKNKFFDYFYPTAVMETGYDILPWWVVRMIMLGYFSTKKIPFKTVVLHGLVRDKTGQKMSKSKGNVINPMVMIDKYGADALRLSLVFETTLGADINFSEEKVIGMRNFVNKVWNIGRFIYLNQIPNSQAEPDHASRDKHQIPNKSQIQNFKLLKQLDKEFNEEKKKYLKLMENYKFSQALFLIYNFIWHRIADFYIEESKKLGKNDKIVFLDLLKKVFLENLKMLHPFVPFVSEAIWQKFNGEKSTLSKANL